jgi:hypothetical protein
MTYSKSMINVENTRSWLGLIQHNTQLSYNTAPVLQESKIFIMDNTIFCFTLLSIILQLYGCGQFYWWRKPEYLERTTDL